MKRCGSCLMYRRVYLADQAYVQLFLRCLVGSIGLSCSDSGGANGVMY